MAMLIKIIQTQAFKKLFVGVAKIYANHTDNKMDDEFVKLIEEII